MEEKYIKELENHVGYLTVILEGKEYPDIARIIYKAVKDSIEAVDLRDRVDAVERRRRLND